MSSKTIYFSQKKKIHSSLTIPTWLHNLLFVVMGSDKEVKKLVKSMALQATALRVDNVSQFVQQELIIGLLGLAEQVANDQLAVEPHVEALLHAFTISLVPYDKEAA